MLRILWALTLLPVFLLGCEETSGNGIDTDTTDHTQSSGNSDMTGGTDGSDEVPIDHCADPVATRDADGNVVIVATDILNYSFESNLEIQTVSVRSDSDLRFDWSGVNIDMLGHPFDPLTSVDMMELMLWRYTKEELVQHINDDDLDTGQLVSMGSVPTAQSTTSANFLELLSPSMGEVPDDQLLEYVNTSIYPPEEHTYFVMVAEGGVYGHGTKMISFFDPSPTETNTEVRLVNDSTILHYTANLTSLKRIAVPTGEPNIVLDWRDNMFLQKNAMGRDFYPTKITDVLVAHYIDKTPADLQSEFLNLELIADEQWSLFLSSGQMVNLNTLNTEADYSGTSFPGIDDVGTWIVALKCGSCANPAPWFLSILHPCPGVV